MLRWSWIVIAASLGLAGCGAVESAQKMPAKMDQMLDGSNHLQSRVDEQAEEIAFAGMMKPENGIDLVPVPFQIMPYARAFAENAKLEHLAEFAFLELKAINETTADSGGLFAKEPSDQFNHRKMQIYSALAAVSGFIPRARIEGLIQSQVYAAGRYRAAVLQMLMLRVRFLRDVRLDNELLANVTDVGQIEAAIPLADEIDYIARLPLADEISVEIHGFTDNAAGMNGTESLNPQQSVETWQKLQRAAGHLQETFAGSPKKNREFYLQQQSRLSQALQTIDARLETWNGKKP